ncbi:MAG: OPT/YSL family transporter [Phycisphaerae bacterium]|nr:OPT/YSL family transporter [Phycisphaerae bacterium]MCZ2399988.1 OPT/YSL family transporter [Phycisphaerae bacterium]
MPDPARTDARAAGPPVPGAPSTGAPRNDGLLQRRYREVTFSAIAFGILFGGIMNAAIAYAGLKIGFTIGGSAIAAVVGFGVLRSLLGARFLPWARGQRRGSILEVNIGQTIASSVNTTNSGVIFTVPVLLLIGHQLSFSDENFWWLTLACVAGGLLGVAFIIPLRKQMLDIDRLRFPSPTAVGAILKSPGAGAAKSVVLLVGVLLGALIYLPAGLPGIRYPAGLGELDAAVRSGVVPATDAARTRLVAEWIAAAAAPPSVVERGAHVAAARERAQEAEGTLEDLGPAISHADTPLPDALCVAAWEASQGRRAWSSLRSADFGWVQLPLPGYSSLNWRMPAETAADGRLTRRVDRDGDQRPDLVLTDTTVDLGRLLGLPDAMQLAFAIAPFALGAGYLTGRAGLMVLAGGILAYFLINPLAYWMGWTPATLRAHEVPGYALGAFNRPLGIGMLLGGALMGVIASLPAIREALKSIGGAARKAHGGRDELGFKSLFGIALLGIVLLLVAMEFAGPEGGAVGKDGWLAGLSPAIAKGVVVLVAVAWTWFAGIIISQCAGMTDWNPISGLALLTVVLVMVLIGSTDVLAAVMIGAALCCAITLASDMMGDLKTGYIVGAQPRRQQVAELITVPFGPIITMSTLVLIAAVNTKATGIPIGPGTDTVAPQAQALQVVIRGVQGGELPYALYGLGGLLGILLGLGSFPGLGVLVGLSIYLPVIYIFTYGLGCLANMAIGKIKGRAWAEEWGVPLCAGLIVGEAMLALVINAIVLIRG